MKNARSTHARATRGRRKPRPVRRTTSHLAKTLVDHDAIRQWAESRDGTPTAVNGTSRGKKDVGMIRIDFPGSSGAGTLEPIAWDLWFEKFDASNLALIVEDKTAGGEMSRVHKLVAREGAGPRRARRRGVAITPSAGARSTSRRARPHRAARR